MRLFEISPDGSRVVYTADQETDNVIELYSTPTDASAMPVKLNLPLAFGVDVDAPRISPDGTRVVFRAGALHSVPIDASSPSVLLHLPPGPFTYTSGVPDFQFSRDGASVFFLASLVAFPITNNWLVLAPIDGSAPTQVVVEPPSIRFNDGVVAFEPTPDGARVVHSADLDSPGVHELYLTALPALR